MTRLTFDQKITKVMGRCRHCTRLCRTQPALHPLIREAMSPDIRPQGIES